MKIKEKLSIAFKKKWVKALRSGKYKQSTSELREKDNTYCCLGVACHVLGVTHITGRGLIIKGNGIRGITKVPKILVGNINKNNIIRQLVNMNSTHDFPFIANWIEKNL